MYKFVPTLRYKINGRETVSTEMSNADFSLELNVEDGSIRCILHPVRKMELVDFTIDTLKIMGSDQVFFVNGFQSWSTSLECTKNDILKGIFPIANINGFAKHVTAMSGDNLFTDYGKKGKFHSFTYTYFRRGKELEFYGSATERTGYTIFEVDALNNWFTIRKDVEGLVIDSDYEILNVMRFKGSYDEVFDRYFDALNLRKSNIKHLSGYTSWYNYFQKINENIILRDLNGLDKVKDSVSIFQIDDGYESFVGDWLTVDPVKFPNGMKYIADRVHDKGYLAGIWIAPFSAQRVSQVAKKHKDWLVKDKNGRPMWGTFAWGGAYTLDFYNEGARAYIKKFFDVILNEWGYDMVKLDFLYSQAIYPRNGKTRGQIMCEAMDFLRECVGEEKLILGCGVPLGPSFGVVDACRISCDVDLVYGGKFYNKLGVNREIPSAQNAINNSIFRRHLNGRVFCNDPDVFFLRKDNLTFTDEQKELLGMVNNMFGDVLFVSDNAGDYGEKETELVRRFFAENDVDVESAQRTDNDTIEIKYSKDGEAHTLLFNIKTGRIFQNN